MREIIYYSRTAPTSGSYIKENLQESGRIDIAIHAIIMTFILSSKIRTDVKLHLIFAGPPDPPKHLELHTVFENKAGMEKIHIAKTNISAILKKMLYKFKEGENKEIIPGFWIERKGMLELINEFREQKRNIYILDPKGEDIRKADIKQNPLFVIGDQHGISEKELKRLKTICIPISLGKRTYFASQTLAVVNNELDRREDAGLL